MRRMKIKMFEDLISYLHSRTDSTAIECLTKIYELAKMCQRDNINSLVDVCIPKVLIIDYLNFKDGS